MADRGGRRFNPYSAHQPSLLRSCGWQASRARPCQAAKLSKPAGEDERRSGQIHGEPFEVGERAVAQRAFVRRTQDHARRLARLECLLPARRTEAPTVAGLEAGKAEFRHRCGKIVAAGFGKREKRGGHDGADRVAADILRPGIAAAVAKEAAHRAYRAEFELFPEHVAGQVRPAPSVAAIVPQHVRLRMSWCRPTTRLLAYNTILGVVRDEPLSAARSRVSHVKQCRDFSASQSSQCASYRSRAIYR